MKLPIIKRVVLLAILQIGFLSFIKGPDVHAHAPEIRGEIYTKNTQMPLENIWVKWTDGRDSGKWRWVKTDNEGQFRFFGWSNYQDPSGAPDIRNKFNCSIWRDQPNLIDWSEPRNESECQARGGIWYGDIIEESLRCNKGWQYQYGATNTILHFAEAQNMIHPYWDSTTTPQNYSTCPGGETCPNNLPFAPNNSCSLTWFNEGGFGCGSPLDPITHTIEAMKPSSWEGRFEPSVIEFVITDNALYDMSIDDFEWIEDEPDPSPSFSPSPSSSSLPSMPPSPSSSVSPSPSFSPSPGITPTPSASLPPEVSPSPLIVFACHGLDRNPEDKIYVGNEVIFSCSCTALTPPFHYNYRIHRPSDSSDPNNEGFWFYPPEWQKISTSTPKYIIEEQGPYLVQCRVCAQAHDENCDGWKPIEKW